MARRQIVFVIVEGPSEETALGVIMSRLFDRDTVFLKITYGDITSELDVTPGNIVGRLGDIVKNYAAAEHYKAADFKQVIHLIDMDGAFIPGDSVVEDKAAVKPFYTPTAIRTANPAAIIRRNQQKAANIKRISMLNKVWNTVPYCAYYMSCNLDHALYGKLNSSDDDKERDAYAFVRRYKDRLDEVLAFISDSEFAYAGDIKGSWKFIQQGKHSLERHSNFGLCFSEIREERKKQS